MSDAGKSSFPSYLPRHLCLKLVVVTSRVLKKDLGLDPLSPAYSCGIPKKLLSLFLIWRWGNDSCLTEPLWNTNPWCHTAHAQEQAGGPLPHFFQALMEWQLSNSLAVVTPYSAEALLQPNTYAQRLSPASCPASPFPSVFISTWSFTCTCLSLRRI